MSIKPWQNKELLESIYSQASIQSDSDAVGFFKSQGIEVSRRALADARAKFNISAPSKRAVVVPDVAFDGDQFDMDHVWNLVLEMQDALQHTRRDKDEVNFNISIDEPVALAFIGDIHMGDVGTDHRQLLEDVKAIKQTENMYLVCGGDYMNNFIKNNRNYNPYEVVQPRVQWRMVEWFFTELEDSIAAVATGNHDGWTEELTQFDALYEVIKRLNFAYAKHGGNLFLNLPGQTYKIRFKHNTRGGAGLNPTAAVKQMIRSDEDADVGALFDTHVPAIEHFLHEGKWRVAIRSGTYKTADHWANQMGFDGNARVCIPVVIFHPSERFFVTAPTLQQGVSMLEWARDSYARGEFGGNYE